MRSEFGLGLRARSPFAAAGIAPLFAFALALVPACSDDGLASQSSGQNGTSTTGGAVEEAGTSSAGSPPDTTANEATSASPPGVTGTDVTGMVDGSSTLGPEADTGTATGTGTGTTGTGTDTETTGGASQACADGCAVEFMCGTEWASAEECVAWCEANLVEADLFSPFCHDAWEALSACLATLTCDEFTVWQSPEMFPYPCSDADVALSVECKGQ